MHELGPGSGGLVQVCAGKGQQPPPPVWTWGNGSAARPWEALPCTKTLLCSGCSRDPCRNKALPGAGWAAGPGQGEAVPTAMGRGVPTGASAGAAPPVSASSLPTGCCSGGLCKRQTDTGSGTRGSQGQWSCWENNPAAVSLQHLSGSWHGSSHSWQEQALAPSLLTLTAAGARFHRPRDGPRGRKGHSPGHCSPWNSSGDSHPSLLSSSAVAACGKHWCGARHSLSSTARRRDGDPETPVPCPTLVDTHSFSAHGYPFHACGGMRASAFPVKSLQRSHRRRQHQHKPFPCPVAVVWPRGWPGAVPSVLPISPPHAACPWSRSRGVPGQRPELQDTHSTEKGRWRVAGGTRARAAPLQSSRGPWQRQGPGQGLRGCARLGARPSSSSTSSSGAIATQGLSAFVTTRGSRLGIQTRCDQLQIWGCAGPAGWI